MDALMPTNTATNKKELTKVERLKLDLAALRKVRAILNRGGAGL